MNLNRIDRIQNQLKMINKAKVQRKTNNKKITQTIIRIMIELIIFIYIFFNKSFKYKIFLIFTNNKSFSIYRHYNFLKFIFLIYN